MKALTFYQPWASLIRDKRKPVETRSWYTKYRGKLAIHAGKTVDKDACLRFGYDPKTIIRGAILCIVDLIDCVKFPSPKVTPDDYGDFTDGRFGWILENIISLPEPIFVKGKMGLWNWQRIKRQRMEEL